MLEFSNEMIYAIIVVVGVSVTLAALFVSHLIDLIKVVAEMTTYHKLSITNRPLFDVLEAQGRVTTSQDLGKRQRKLFWSTLACALWWSSIIGVLAIRILGA